MLRPFYDPSRFSQQRVAFVFLFAAIFTYILFSTTYTPHRLVVYVQSIAIGSGDGETSPDAKENESVTRPGYTQVTETSSNNAGIPNSLSFVDPFESFDGLAQLCQETDWREGLWLQCHSRCGENGTSICGGLNNARNRIQTCLRLAIDAGSGLILPSTTVRDEKALVNTNVKSVCPETFWDTKYLQAALQEQCPQLKIRQCDDLTGIDTIIHAPPRTYTEAAFTNGTFRDLVSTAFDTANYSLASVSSKDPIAISFGDSYIGWNYRETRELSTIRKALFKVLKFNRNLLDMSAQILESPQLHEGSFIGVHLRGENDWPAGFGTVDDQMRLYIEEISRIQSSLSYEVKTVYVSVCIPLFYLILSILKKEMLTLGMVVRRPRCDPEISRQART
jgi:hypothetical protein